MSNKNSVLLKFHLGLLGLVLTAGYAQVLHATEPNESTTSTLPETPLKTLAVSPVSMLEKLKLAVLKNSLLSESFYTEENLNNFFGEPYQFKFLNLPKALNVEVISFSDTSPSDTDKPQSASGQTQPLPVFNNGKIYLSVFGNNQLTSHVILALNPAVHSARLVDAKLVEQVFGQPTSMDKLDSTEADRVNDAKRALKIHSLGNSLLKYQSVDGDIFKTVQFKTAENEDIIEIQIYTGHKQ